MALVATRLPVKLVLTMASSPADISLLSFQRLTCSGFSFIKIKSVEHHPRSTVLHPTWTSNSVDSAAIWASRWTHSCRAYCWGLWDTERWWNGQVALKHWWGILYLSESMTSDTPLGMSWGGGGRLFFPFLFPTVFLNHKVLRSDRGWLHFC